MTITEQLQFSVLTAPLAALDRRTLSQAWYSALYGSAGAAKAAAKTPAPAALPAAAPPEAAHTVRAESETTAGTRAAGVTTPRHAEGTPQDRRAPRSTLARKIERVFLRPRNASHKASFTIDGEHGRVHVLLQSRGTQLKLVAICPPKARSRVATALAQARYALALRGIDLDADTRGAAQC